MVSFHWLQSALDPIFKNIRTGGNDYSCAFKYNAINTICIREGGCWEITVRH